jgi:hypothetical protein
MLQPDSPSVQTDRLNVFISYSVHDRSIVSLINTHLQPHARTFFWDQDKAPGLDVWPTIYSWIDRADLAVVVLTGKTLTRAISVGNEVGYARKAGKRIIPLVAPEVPKGELGCLEGVTYIRLDYDSPAATLAELKREIEKFAQEKSANAKAFAVLGLLVLGLIAFSK